MATSLIHSSFAAGEIAPGLYGRVDFQKYSSAATTLRNAYVSYRGGAYSRAGTEYVLRSKTTPGPGVSPPHLITFQFSINEGICLELGNHYMRFFINGAPVTETPFNISAVTQTSPAVVTIPGSNYVDGDWISVSGVNGMTPLNGRTFIVTNVGGDDWSIRNLNGTAVDSTSFPPYVSGGTTARIYEIATPWTGADAPDVKFTESADVMSLVHPSYPPYDLARITNTNWTLTAVTFSSGISAPWPVFANASNHPDTTTTPIIQPCAYAYQVTAVGADGQESIPGGIANVVDSVDMAITAGSITTNWPSVAGAQYYKIYRAPPSYNTDPGNPGAALPVPRGAIFSLVGLSFGTQFVDTNIIANTSFSPPKHINPFAPGRIIGAFPTAPGSGYVDNGFTGPIVTITTSTGSGALIDPVVVNGEITGYIIQEPGQDYAPGDSATVSGGGGGGATLSLTLSAQTGVYPSVVSYFQQRRVYASTINQPDTYFMSKPGKYLNFDSSIPTSDSDAITGTPWAQQVNGIQWMVQMPGGLICFTGRGGWQVTGQGSSALSPAPITPSSQQAQQVMFNGISPDVPPITVNFDILYVQSKGTKVLDAAYNFFTNNYTGTDQTVLSSHLFSDFEISDWAWCEEPGKIVWAVRCDGVLLSFTFLKEQEIYGWARHDTQGQFVSATSVTEPPVDALYCVVLRNMPTGPAYFIERMNNRIWPTTEDPWCVDCALEYPQLRPGVDITADSLTGNVNFIADAPAFPPTSVGSVLRVGGGIATISAITDSQHISGVWVVPPPQTVPGPP